MSQEHNHRPRYGGWHDLIFIYLQKNQSRGREGKHPMTYTECMDVTTKVMAANKVKVVFEDTLSKRSPSKRSSFGIRVYLSNFAGHPLHKHVPQWGPVRRPEAPGHEEQEQQNC